MIHRKHGRDRDENHNYRNGGARNDRDTIWPFWVIGIAAVTITAAVGMWAFSP